MYSVRRGTNKNHPGQSLLDKQLRTKPRGQKPLWAKIYVCMHVLLKIRGFRDVWHTLGEGGSRDVWQCVTGGGGGSKLVQNSVTYFMDGPLYLINTIWTPHNFHSKTYWLGLSRLNEISLFATIAVAAIWNKSLSSLSDSNLSGNTNIIGVRGW